MSEADALRSLLARLEAGEQPSIALDVALWEAFGRLKLDTDEPPLRSLDAAVALCERVKPGWAWDVMFESERLLGTASPHKAYWGSVRRYRTSFDKDHIGHAATPALALCIAVVKAKLAEVEHAHDRERPLSV
jgi:hypothetical protein